MFTLNNICNISIIVLYLGAVIWIGLRFSKSDENTEQYLMGGRRVPFIAVGISCMMSLFSSVSLVRSTGEIVNHGMMLGWGAPIIQILTIPAYLVFMRFYFKLGSCTPYEYLEYRYDSSVRLLVSICGFYSRVMYIGTVLYTTAKIFEGAYNWPAWFSILLVGVFGVIYTVMGGLQAVIWTDVMQFVVLTVGAIAIVIAFHLCIDGGLVEAVACTFREGHGYYGFSDPNFYKITPYVRLLFWVQIYGILTSPLSTASSDQINIQRLLATKNWKEGLRSQCISSCLALGVIACLLLIGCACFTYYHQNPSPIVAEKGGDIAFFHFIGTKLPPPLPGLFMAALLAAIMSTLDSGMNSMATVWLKEFHVRYIKPGMSEKEQVKVSKWATGIVGVFSILLGLALNFSGKWLSQTTAEVGTIFGILGAATFPAFILGVLTCRCNSKMIWGYTVFASGGQYAWITWYTLSRRALLVYEQAKEAGEACQLGWAGPLGWKHVVVPLVLGIVLLIVAHVVHKVKNITIFLDKKKQDVQVKPAGKWWKVCYLVCLCLGLAVLGWTMVMAIWYYYSNTGDTSIPRARSFAFHLPVAFFAFIIYVCCHRKLPREEYQGLTLSTINEPILKHPEGVRNLKEKPQS